jgi:hypothetical protein
MIPDNDSVQNPSQPEGAFCLLSWTMYGMHQNELCHGARQ